jgi:quinol monooxygenase YgiN
MAHTPGEIVVTATLTPKQGETERVLHLLQSGTPAVHEEDGCLLYALHTDEAGHVVILEKWRDSHSLEAHARGGAVARNDASIDGLLAEETVVTKLIAFPLTSRDPRGEL